jgi:hypothetical protein
LQLVAVLATLYFWVMIYLLEAVRIEQLVVAGVEHAHWGRATDAYREALTQAGCRVLGHSKNFKKGQITFTLRVPRTFTSDEVNRALSNVPSELRGAFDWPE